MAAKVRNSNIIWICLCIIVGIVFWQAYQGQRLKKQADELVRFGKPAEAIQVYERAEKMFPFRWDITSAIEGAKLIIASNKDFESIADVAEFQTPPDLSALPIIPLKANEVFVPVLMYHHIRINPRPIDPVWAALNVSPTQLDQQLSYLVSHNYHIITLDDLSDSLEGKASLPENPIILTFDDGYRNFYEQAFPILQKYQVKATEFVITGVVGTDPYLTWDQISQMDASGLVTFGAHTMHHPNLPNLSQKDIVAEIVGSKIDLEKHLRKPTRWFAYPYGSYNAFILQSVKDAGFRGAASTIYGASQSTDNLYLSPRIMVDGRFTLDNIARRIQH